MRRFLKMGSHLKLEPTWPKSLTPSPTKKRTTKPCLPRLALDGKQVVAPAFSRVGTSCRMKGTHCLLTCPWPKAL